MSEGVAVLPLLLSLAFVPSDVDGRPLPPGAVGRLGSGKHSPGLWATQIRPTADPSRVVLAGWDRVMLWDLAAGQAVWTAKDADFACLQNGYSCPLGVVPGTGEVRVLGQRTVDGITVYEVRAFDGRTGRVVRRTPIRTAGVADLSADGRIAVFATDANAVTALDAAKGRVLWSHTFPAGQGINCVAASAGRVAVCCGGTVHLADAWEGKPQPAQAVFAQQLLFSPDERTLVGVGRLVGATEDRLFAWDIPGKQFAWTRPATQNLWYSRPVFTTDGAHVLLGERDADGRLGIIRITTAEGTPVGKPVPAAEAGTVTAAGLPDGRILTAASTVGLWDPATGRRLGPDPEPIPLYGPVRFADGGRRVVAEPGWGGRRVWELATGRDVERLTHVQAHRAGLARPIWYDSGWTGGPTTAFSRDGRRKAVVPPIAVPPGQPMPASRDIVLSDPTTGKETGKLTVNTYEVSSLEFTPDSRHLLVGKSMDKHFLYDLTAKAPPAEFGQFVNEGSASGTDRMYALDPAGRRIAVITKNRGPGTDNPGRHEVTVYDLPTLAVACRFDGPGQVLSLSWSDDGRRLAAAGSAVFVGEVPGGRAVTLTQPKSGQNYWNTSGISMSADGRMVAVSEYMPAGLRVLEVATGGERLKPPTGGNAGFSPDSRLLAAVDADNTVLLYPLSAAPAADAPADEWAALGGEPTVAFKAVRRLAANPNQAVPLLRKHLPPVPDPDPKRVAELIVRLNAPVYAERRAAAAELRKLGVFAKPALTAAGQTGPAEVRRVALGLLADLAAVKPTADDIRAVRAVEAVEWMSTPDARRLLADWAAGSPHARLTAEAKDAVERLRASR